MRAVTMKALSSGALVVIQSLVSPSSYAQVATSGADVRDRYQAAISLMAAREYARAVDALRRIIADYPDFPEAYRSFERASVILDDVDGAAAFLAERVTATPRNAFCSRTRSTS